MAVVENLLDLPISDTNHSISSNLSWLEHETKINEVLSIAREASARSTLNSIAISTIADLTATMKDLKKEVTSLKAEVSILRENGKTRLTPEEKEELIAENLKWFENKLIKDMLESPTVDGISPNTQVQMEGFISDLQFASEMIASKVKTINQGNNIMKLFIERFCSGCRILCLSSFKNMGNPFSIYCNLPKRGEVPWFLVKDYKIIFKVLYEIDKRQLKRYILSHEGTYMTAERHSNKDEAIEHYFRLVALKEGELYEHDGIRHPRRSPPIEQLIISQTQITGSAAVAPGSHAHLLLARHRR